MRKHLFLQLSLLLILLFLCMFAYAEYYAPEYVVMKGGENGVEPTQTLQLTAYVYPENAKQVIKWESLDPKIATIDQNGLVTAKKPGSVYIRAYCRENQKLYAQIKLSVKYKPAPEAIQLPESELSIKNGDSYQLIPSFFPADASTLFTCSSSNPSVASVTGAGKITAKAYGKSVITVKSRADSSVSCKITVTVTDSRVPELLAAYPSQVSLEPSMSCQVSLLVLPEALNASLLWKSSNESVAVCDPTGRITAVSPGKAVITVCSQYASSVSYSIPVSVAYGANVTKITLPVSDVSLKKGDVLPLNYTVEPKNASRALVFEFSDPAVARVDDEGNLIALKYGETDLRISFHKNASVRAQMHITVTDSLHPITMTSDTPTEFILRTGESASVSVSFTPETADRGFILKSSNDKIAAAAGSTILPVSPGVCIIRAESTYNPELYVDIKVTVESDEYTLIMPERRTGIDEIPENLEKIDAVRESAKRMLLKDYENGDISEKEYRRRLEIIEAAFEMYDFPWMVTQVEKYWMPENSEDGAKDFKPGIVYYGLPYTSGGNSSRTYTVQRAIDDKWYVKAPEGDHYLFNVKNKLYDGRYAGNDCSSFISLALFNSTRYQGETVKTYTLYYDDRLVTTDDPETLRAGDILVRHSIHVIMFLYWADDAHTQAVFIEQGGNEPGINTISTSVYNIADYTENYYHIRVLRSFD